MKNHFVWEHIYVYKGKREEKSDEKRASLSLSQIFHHDNNINEFFDRLFVCYESVTSLEIAQHDSGEREFIKQITFIFL